MAQTRERLVAQDVLEPYNSPTLTATRMAVVDEVVVIIPALLDDVRTADLRVLERSRLAEDLP